MSKTDAVEYSKTKVLIVDDEPEIREVLRDYIESMGYEVREAGTVDEAIQALKVSPPEIVLTDIRMPGKSGIDLLHYIIIHFGRSLSTAVLSANSHFHLKELFHLGVNAILPKPFQNEWLLEALRHCEQARNKSYRRSSPRMKISANAEIASATGKNMFLRATDISFKGTQLLGPLEHLQIGSKVEVALEFSSSRSALTCLGTVKWKSNGEAGEKGRIGLEFEGVYPEQQAQIDRYFRDESSVILN